MKILFTGGGSGGHIFPLIAVAREIKRIMPKDIDLVYAGPKDEWASLYLSQEDIRIKGVLAGKVRRYFTPQALLLNLLDVFKSIFGFFQAFFVLLLENPGLVFSKGGYGSIPIVLASKILNIPIFMHESDISPGLANQITAKFSLEVFTSFPKTEYIDPKKIILVGNPIRREIFEGSESSSRELLGLSGQRPVILFLGGSQGAQRMNDFILLVLPELLKDFEIIHQCGRKKFKTMKNESRVVIKKGLEKYYHLFPFLKEREVKEAYFSADLVVCRAGAGAIFEAAGLGKPSILIPLPESAQNHQVKNAYAYAQKGATLVMEETNLSPHFFLEKLKLLMSQPEKMEKMSQAAQEFSKPMAAKVIAQYLLEYLLS